MPSTLQALLVFALFIVPGFLLRTAYVRTRAHGAASTALYALAEAVVASAFLIAALWWWQGEDIVEWARDGKLADHSTELYAHALVLLLAPYPLGLMAGWVMTTWLGGLQRTREFFEGSETQPNNGGERVFALLDRSGLLNPPTIWDYVWNVQLREEQSVSVRIGMKSGAEIVGEFGPGSWVGLSPEPRQLYLSREYRPDDHGGWQAVPRSKGVFIDAAEVEFLAFAQL